MSKLKEWSEMNAGGVKKENITKIDEVSGTCGFLQGDM